MKCCCGNCGKPVAIINGSWKHSLTEDYHGPCYWGRPTEPEKETILS